MLTPFEQFLFIRAGGAGRRRDLRRLSRHVPHH